MGMEHRGKGVDIQLGPVAGPLGRAPEGARNWEGFSPDPILTGAMFAESIKGIQSAGSEFFFCEKIWRQKFGKLLPDTYPPLLYSLLTSLFSNGQREAFLSIRARPLPPG